MKIGVAFTLLLVIFINFDGVLAIEIMANLPFRHLLLAVIFSLVLITLAAIRWSLVAKALGTSLPLSESLVVTLEAHFLNQALPATVGGDVYRIWLLRRLTGNSSAAVMCIFSDRLLGMLALLLIAGITYPLAAAELADVGVIGSIPMVISLLVAGLALGAIIVLLLKKKTRINWAARVFNDLLLLGRHPMLLLLMIAISILAHLQLISMFYALAIGLGLKISFYQALLVFPVVILASTIPITAAGWGVREATLIILLGYFDVQSQAAIALGVSFGLIMLLVSFPGGILWLKNRHEYFD